MSTAAPLAPGTVTGPRWPVQRILFLIAGTVTLLSVLAAVTLSPWFLVVTALVGANQLLMVATGWCPMSLLLTRLGARPACG